MPSLPSPRNGRSTRSGLPKEGSHLLRRAGPYPLLLLQGPPQRSRERFGVARLLMTTAVDEEPGRAGHAALGAAHEVLTDPRGVDVGAELAPHPLRVEPQLAGVPHQILVRERRLPLVQETVHLPELPLRRSRLRDLRGVLGVRVLLTQRKMPEHEPNLASELLQHLQLRQLSHGVIRHGSDLTSQGSATS